MRVLVDTNVLLRIADPAHPAHTSALVAVQELQSRDHELFLVPQVICEFWSVATRSVEANGLGKPPAYAETLIPRFCKLFRLLRDERAIYETWLQLVSRQAVSGVKTFDARLAAAMLRHGLTHLLTFNPGDFRRYGHVALLDPTLVAQGQGADQS